MNEDFTLWCGNRACAWEVEEGTVAPMPTWHRKATGIGLIDNPTRISQVVEMENVRCLNLAVLADLEDGVSLHFQVDFFNDGLDARDPDIALDDGNWTMRYQETPVPEGCTSARIILEKTGAGLAIVDKARVSADSYCADNTQPSADTTDQGPDAAAGVCAVDGGAC